MSANEEDRALAEHLIRQLFPIALEGQLVGSIIVIATGVSTDDDDKIVSWYDGSAHGALGMVVVMQQNLLDALSGKDDDQ